MQLKRLSVFRTTLVGLYDSNEISNVRSGQKLPESEAVTKGKLKSSALHHMDQHSRNYSTIQRLHSPQISGRFIAKVGRCIPSALQLARNSYPRRNLLDITSSNALAANAGQAGSGGVVRGKDWQVQSNLDITISILPFFTNDIPRYHYIEDFWGLKFPCNFGNFHKSLRFKACDLYK